MIMKGGIFTMQSGLMKRNMGYESLKGHYALMIILSIGRNKGGWGGPRGAQH